MKQEDLLKLAGNLARAARNVCGGQDLNGFEIPPANAASLSYYVQQLLIAVESYDVAVLEREYERSKEDDQVREVP